RNMAERVEQLDGQFRILSSASGAGGGTVIEVSVPLSHLLPPEPAQPDNTPALTDKERARA
ncbi:MAG: hypothetical protein AAF252_03990, partial [Pseudomonadota bacterium]